MKIFIGIHYIPLNYNKLKDNDYNHYKIFTTEPIKPPTKRVKPKNKYRRAFQSILRGNM